MATTYPFPLSLIIALFAFILVLMCGVGYCVWIIFKKRLLDRIILIDKDNRWRECASPLSKRKTFKDGDNEYVLHTDCALLNKRGKALYIFSEDKASPLKLRYNKQEWLDSKSIMGVLQNKMVQQIVKPTDKFIDMLVIMGAIGGIIACIASVINVLIATGVISPK